MGMNSVANCTTSFVRAATVGGKPTFEDKAELGNSDQLGETVWLQ